MATRYVGGRHPHFEYDNFAYPYRAGLQRYPFYDDKADYNTNSKSYYDYLGRNQHVFGWLVDMVNYLLRREIRVCDTKTVDLRKNYKFSDHQNCSSCGGCGCGDCNDNCCEQPEIMQLSANVKVSRQHLRDYFEGITDEDIDVGNGLKVLEDGLWVADSSDIMKQLLDKLKEKDNRIDDLENQLKDLQSKYDTLYKGMERIVNNLDKSGAVTENSVEDFKFYDHIHIATGNINLFSDKADGDSYIKTHKEERENDVAIGYTK